MNRKVVKKRFIAGAICPECKQADKIFTFFESDEEGAQKWRACANCKFEQVLSQEAGVSEELHTRVNQLRVGEKPLAHETEIEELQFFEPPKDH